eukprot:TRINITY_DN10519_c0_g1_i2.p1 TRINITY_DN10519_c0_g1~~TRINITY_DN10519_c0_g1_i2.p1  ORF type:complete len:220 (-),score=19.87 TRINITY_DN10519_c0_g1_i2:507-1166(-)
MYHDEQSECETTLLQTGLSTLQENLSILEATRRLLQTPEIKVIDMDRAADATNVLQWREIIAQGAEQVEFLLLRIEMKFWIPHAAKVETGEIKELRRAFEVVRDNIRAAVGLGDSWTSQEHLIRSMNKSLENLIETSFNLDVDYPPSEQLSPQRLASWNNHCAKRRIRERVRRDGTWHPHLRQVRKTRMVIEERENSGIENGVGSHVVRKGRWRSNKVD